MSDPARLVLAKRISASFEQITYTDFDGDVIDMTGNVFRGRGVYGDETPVPCISILESPIPEQQNNNRGTGSKGLWELVIQGFVRDDRANPTDPAQILMAEVKKVLVQEKLKLDEDKPEDGPWGMRDHITDISIGSGVVRPPDEISAKAYFWLTLGLNIVEDLQNPSLINGH